MEFPLLLVRCLSCAAALLSLSSLRARRFMARSVGCPGREASRCGCGAVAGKPLAPVADCPLRLEVVGVCCGRDGLKEARFARKGMFS